MQVIEYLTAKGFKFHKKGRNFFTNSPFNPNDRTPSFCVFPDGGFKDFSSGKAGNIITLTKHFGDKTPVIIPSTTTSPPKKKWPGFVPTTFTEITPKDREEIEQYANSRGIYRGYLSGRFFIKTDSGFDTHPAVLFPHRDKDMSITGGKFRAIHPGQRFSSSGALGFYILENVLESFEKPTLYIVEGEANANSLWEHLRNIAKSGVVMSAGGVTSIPKQIPHKFQCMDCKVIIDYDGDEIKYNERIARYLHLGSPVKLILPKGSDLNSLGDLSIINSIL